jgi:hypothetical protein
VNLSVHVSLSVIDYVMGEFVSKGVFVTPKIMTGKVQETPF